MHVNKKLTKAHGVLSERFHFDVFQKALDLLTKFNENQNEPRLWTVTSCDENFHC